MKLTSLEDGGGVIDTASSLPGRQRNRNRSGRVVVDFARSVFQTHADFDHLAGVFRTLALVGPLRQSRSIRQPLIRRRCLPVSTAGRIRSPAGTRLVSLPPRTLSSYSG